MLYALVAIVALTLLEVTIRLLKTRRAARDEKTTLDRLRAVTEGTRKAYHYVD